MMAFPRFVELMGPVRGRWKKAYSDEMMLRIYSFVKELPETGLIRIVNSMLDTQRNPPLPKDFLEAAISERKRIFDRNEERKATKYEEHCVHCGDIGVVEVKVGENKSLMLCDCNDASDFRAPRNKWKLPTWNTNFKRRRCSTDWFTPQKRGEILGVINERRDGWIERLKIAEQFWGNFNAQAQDRNITE